VYAFMLGLFARGSAGIIKVSLLAMHFKNLQAVTWSHLSGLCDLPAQESRFHASKFISFCKDFGCDFHSANVIWRYSSLDGFDLMGREQSPQSARMSD